jgi:hypothetical protein
VDDTVSIEAGELLQLPAGSVLLITSVDRVGDLFIVTAHDRDAVAVVDAFGDVQVPDQVYVFEVVEVRRVG